MQDVADGIMASDVLYLTSAELVSRCQNAALFLVQTRYHLVPHVQACFDGGFLKFDFIEKPALERLVHVLGEIGGGNENAVESLHLLKDDVLDGVFHLVHSPFGSFLPLANHSVGLVE